MKRSKYVISQCIADEKFEQLASEDLDELSEEFEGRLQAWCDAYPGYVEFHAIGQRERDALTVAQEMDVADIKALIEPN